MDGAHETSARARLPARALLTADDAHAIEALSRVLRFAAMQLQVEFARLARVDHTYIAGAARAALTEDGEPTDLALRAGLSLRHMLIDEFQDTSLAQFELLEALTVGWEAGDGRTLFVVGDPMQSIYQFREAEVGLFLRARDHGIGSVPARAAAAHAQLSFGAGADRVDQSHLRAALPAARRLAGQRGRVHDEPCGARPAVNERRRASGCSMRAIARPRRGSSPQRISAASRGHAGSATIAVLVASRAHAPPIMAALRRADIDAIGVDLVPLRELFDRARSRRAAARFASPRRSHGWLTVLRAPWCGVSLADAHGAFAPRRSAAHLGSHARRMSGLRAATRRIACATGAHRARC